MRRLSLSLLLLLLIGTIAVGWGIDKLFTHFYPSENTSLSTALTVGSTLAKTIDESGTTPTLSDNTSIINKEELALPDELQTLLDAGEPITLESNSGIDLYFNLPNTQRVLSLSLPQQSSNTALRLMLTILFYSCVILLVLAWLYPLIRRLRALEKSAKAFGNGELDRRVTTHAGSQLHGIETEFNSMAQRIDGLVSDNKLLSSAVSHDLRTPLARLRFGVDALQEKITDEDQTNHLNRLSDDLTEMEQLVSVLLEFAKLDKELHDLPLSDVDLVSIIEHSVQTAQDFSDHNISFHTELSELVIPANERYTSIMINNLLQNAIRYGDSTVSITLTQEPTHSCLCIDDDGPGIPLDAREHVLKPFTRHADRQNKAQGAKGGYGLGLAIVSRIAEWHQAILTIGDSETLKGASMQIRFNGQAKKA